MTPITLQSTSKSKELQKRYKALFTQIFLACHIGVMKTSPLHAHSYYLGKCKLNERKQMKNGFCRIACYFRLLLRPVQLYEACIQMSPER